MIRRFDGERPVFLLDTEHTSYAFRVLPTGHAEHLYYGRRIGADSAAALEPLTEKADRLRKLYGGLPSELHQC